MRNFYVTLSFITLIFNSLYGQINFEKGYLINNNNDTTFCYIKNVDWKNNPTEVNYRISLNEKNKKATIEDIKEFSISGASKYKRFNVKIDRADNIIANMSHVRMPEFRDEILFLKVLVEGDANLYSYEDGNLIRFFYKSSVIPIEQLIFKEYISNQNEEVRENNTFRFQLNSYFKCEKIGENEINKLKYQKKDLIHIFNKFNNCKSKKSDITIKNKKDKDKSIYYNLKAGVSLANFSNYSIGIGNYKNVEINDIIGPTIGLEFEYVLPFNNRKWSVIMSPSIILFKKDKDYIHKSPYSGPYPMTTASFQYNLLNAAIGLRHKFYLNNSNAIFINALYTINKDFNSKITYSRENYNDEQLNINHSDNFAFGTGYSFNNRLNVEIRYNLKHRILDGYIYHNNFDYYSLTLSYRIF